MRAVLSPPTVSTRRPSGLKAALPLPAVALEYGAFRPAPPIEDSRRGVAAGRDNAFSVRTEGDAVDVVLGAIHDGDLPVSGRSPHSHRAPAVDAGNVLPVWAEHRMADDFITLRAQDGEVPGRQLPEPCAAVSVRDDRSQSADICLPYDVGTAKDIELFSGRRSPDVHVPVVACRDDGLAIRREPSVLDFGGLAREYGQRLPSSRLPDAGGAVFACGDDAPSVRTECRVPDSSSMTLEDSQLRSRYVPDPRGAVGAAGDEDPRRG